MKKVVYLSLCLVMMLSARTINADGGLDDYILKKPRVEKSCNCDCKCRAPEPRCKERCYNCCGTNLRFYIKAELGKDFSKDFARHWAIGIFSTTGASLHATPDYVGGALTNRIMYGFAAGYIFNEFFRIDINWQNRDLKYSAENGGVAPNCPACSSNIQKQKINSNSIFLNGYFNIADCPCMFTPYFTAGAGYAYNKSETLSNISTSTSNGKQFTFEAPGKKTHSFSWNVGVGLLSKLSRNLDLDIVYRYVVLGTTGAKPTMGTGLDANTPPAIVLTPVNPSSQKLRVHEIAAGITLKF